MRDLLFSVPWYLPTLLAIVGLALFVRGNRRQIASVRTSGVALIGLAVLWAVVSYLVETPKEICDRQTREYVRAVVNRDWTKFDSLNEPSFRFTAGSTGWQIDGSNNWSADVKSGADQIGLKSATITGLTADESGNVVTTTIRVFSVQDASMGQPVASDWELEWRPSGNKWLLHELRAVHIEGASLEEVRGRLRMH